MVNRLSLSFFGTPQITVDGELIEINRRKAVALLAYLAVTQQVHSRDALATMFWPETDQGRARASLRSALWTLNKTPLEGYLLVDAEAASLRTAAEMREEPHDSAHGTDVDVVRFRTLLAAWKAHEHKALADCPRCLELLTEAVALYQDDFLAGFTLPDAPQFDKWHFFEDSDLRQDLANGLQALVNLHSAHEDFERAIPFARRLVSLDPLHEPAQRTLMQLYARSGQQSAALRQYELCRERLASELGVEPSPETDALYKDIQRGAWRPASDHEAHAERSDLGRGHETGPTRRAHSHNLPAMPGPLIGRKRELGQLTPFLEDPTTRLVTITGPGGMGKTRLALAAAGEQLGRPAFPDGIAFVSLAPISDLEGIIPAIAEAVGYPFQADKRSLRAQLFDFLAGKSMLLVLDNVEHLLFEEQPDGATFVADLLQRAPQVTVLTTSREALDLYEEQRFPLHGLPVSNDDARGGADSDAAQLFLQAVRRRRPSFHVAPGDMDALHEICRLVEGLPLALELAAARTDILSLGQIADEIRQNLDFMETNARNVASRHRSMQAVFDSSWQSLTEKEQAIYARLSVFRGGFTQEAAEAVAGASWQTLTALANKSLLWFSQKRKRFEHHELLRQYAAARLVDPPTTRQRHAATFASFLEQRESDLKGPRQLQAMAEIEADGENALTAWQWAVEQAQVGLLERSLTALALYYERRSRFADGEALWRVAIEKLGSIPAGAGSEQKTETANAGDSRRAHLLAKLLAWQGRFDIYLEEYEQARHALRRARRILDGLDLARRDVVATRAFLLLQLADYSIINEFGGEAEALNEESLTLYRSIDDEWGTALALDLLSQKKMNRGLYEEALQLLEECLAIRQHLQDRQGIARSYSILGLVVLHIGQIERSEAYLRKSLSLFRAMGHRGQLSNPLAVLGINLLFGGKFEACLASYEECWAIHRELGLKREPLTANVGMTRAKINLGRYEEARKQAEGDLAAYRASGHDWSIAFTLFNLGRLDLVEGATYLARQRFEESARILQKMNEQSLLPDVLFCLSYAFLALNEREKARQAMVQALEIAIETEPLNPMRFELPGMALLLADEGQYERAIEFYAAALQSPYIANSRWFEDLAARRMAELAATLAPGHAAAAQERGRARDLWETANAILAELRA